MKIGEIIKNKDYDYIEYRMTVPDYLGGDVFFGCAKSKDGKLLPLDGDYYSENQEILDYEEWSQDGIENGLTVIVKGDWIQ